MHPSSLCPPFSSIDPGCFCVRSLSSLTCRSFPCEILPSFSLKFLVIEAACETRLQFCEFNLAYAGSPIRSLTRRSGVILYYFILFVRPAAAHFVFCIWHGVFFCFGIFFRRNIRFLSNWTCFYRSIFTLPLSISFDAVITSYSSLRGSSGVCFPS